MTRFALVALAATILGACTPPDITSRMETADALFSGFNGPENYAPEPVGARTANDFMRFSTAAIGADGPF